MAAGVDGVFGIYMDPIFFTVRDRQSTALHAKSPPTSMHNQAKTAGDPSQRYHANTQLGL